jgi:hypothetical protein
MRASSRVPLRDVMAWSMRCEPARLVGFGEDAGDGSRSTL